MDFPVVYATQLSKIYAINFTGRPKRFLSRAQAARKLSLLLGYLGVVLCSLWENNFTVRMYEALGKCRLFINLTVSILFIFVRIAPIAVNELFSKLKKPNFFIIGDGESHIIAIGLPI